MKTSHGNARAITTIRVATIVLIVALSIDSLARAAETITRYPYLQPTADMETSIGIAWETETVSDCVVQYGIKSAEENKVKSEHKGVSPRGKQRYYTKLINLSPGTEYKYKVVAGNAATPEYTLLTSSSKDDFAYRIFVFSDPHADENLNFSKPYNEKIIADVKTFKPHLVLCIGDLAMGHSQERDSTPNQNYIREYAIDQEFETLFTLYRDVFANAIFAPVCGNHDLTVKNSYDYRIFADEFYLPENGPEGRESKYFTQLFVKECNYSFNYGGIHFPTLGIGYIKFSDQAVCNALMVEPYKWLENDLNNAIKTGKIRNIIGQGHIIEPYSTLRTDIPMPRTSGEIIYTNILDKHKVALVLSGHHHAFERTYPLDHGGDTSSKLACPTTQEKSNYKNYAGVIYHTIPSPYFNFSVSDWPQLAFKSSVYENVYATIQVSAGGRKIEVKSYHKNNCVDSYTIERDISKK